MNQRWKIASRCSWVLVAILAIGVNIDSNANWRYLLDMHVYIQGAEHFWHGENLYAVEFPTHSENLPFTYPPFGAIVFTPLWLLTEAIGQVATERVFTVVSIAALWLIAHSVRSVFRTEIPTSVLLAVLMCGLPTLSTLDIGQINTILMALVLLDVTRAFDRIPLGILTGIASAIKLTPLVFGLFFLVLLCTRRTHAGWKGLLGMGGGFFGAGAAAWLINPGNSLQYWSETLSNSGRIGDFAYAKNVSLQGMISRIPEFGGNKFLWLVGVILVIALATIAVFRLLRNNSDTASQTLAVALSSLIALLCSPISWHHHWVWLGALSCILWLSGHRFFACWAFFAQTLGSFHMFISGGGGNGQEAYWTLIQHILATHYVWFTIILLGYFAFRPSPIWDSRNRPAVRHKRHVKTSALDEEASELQETSQKMN